jgi:hypothetical protein
MKRSLKIALLLVITVAVYITYADKQKPAELPKKHTEIKTQQSVRPLTGTVVETMDSGGYTYINIEKNNNKTWVAVPKMEIKVGQEMSFYPGTAMRNFESKSLKRTFKSVIFSPGPMEKDSSSAALDPHGNKSTTSVVKEKISVDKATGPDAYTIAEIYDKRTTLDKKQIVVRGKVVKVSANIMKKNWVHLQDGSGDPKDGTHDLIVTSEDLPKVGDIVTASGTLMTNKNIGSGYSFDVVVEKAKIKQ